MSSDGYINVLSLDGGGIKGLYSASVLEHIESVFDCPITSGFDLICGTSTGGLIALALASGNSAKSISDFYYTKGGSIFPYTSDRSRKWHKFRSIFISSKYPATFLKSELVNYFGEQLRMDDLHVNVCIPSFNINTGEAVVFKKSNDLSLYLDKDVKVVDVALATSAAPTYFPIHEIQGTKYRDGQYIDGGIWANDPSLCALLEIVRGHSADYKPKVRIISISAVPLSPRIKRAKKLNYSARHWGGSLFDIALHAQQTQNPRIMQWLSKQVDIEYYRIEPTNLTLAEINLVGMDYATQECLDWYRTTGKNSGIKYISSNSAFLNRLFNIQKP